MWAEEGDTTEQEEQSTSGDVQEDKDIKLKDLEENENSSPEEYEDPAELNAVYDIPVQISAVLGKATMPVNQLLKLGRGAVVELDRRIGEAIDIYVNNRLVARGEVVVVDDRLGITMTEIIKTEA